MRFDALIRLPRICREDKLTAFVVEPSCQRGDEALLVAAWESLEHGPNSKYWHTRAVMDLITNVVAKSPRTVTRVRNESVPHQAEKHVAFRIQDVASQKWIVGFFFGLRAHQEEVIGRTDLS
jgi:hypothetical protein